MYEFDYPGVSLDVTISTCTRGRGKEERIRNDTRSSTMEKQ